jgi:hypothetical protein
MRKLGLCLASSHDFSACDFFMLGCLKAKGNVHHSQNIAAAKTEHSRRNPRIRVNTLRDG